MNEPSVKVNPAFVEEVEQLQEILEAQLGGPLVFESLVVQDSDDFLPKLLQIFVPLALNLHLLSFPLRVYLLPLFLPLHHINFAQLLNQLIAFGLLVLLRVGLEHLNHFLVLESCLQSFVLSKETNTKKSVPLEEVNVGQRVLRLNSHDTALHLWRRFEVVFPHFYEVIDLRKQLNVDAQSAVQFGARLSCQSLGKLFLEHQHCTSEHGLLREELKDQRRTYLVGDVCYTYVEEREFHRQHISRDEDELMSILGVLESLGELGNHARINFNSNDFLSFFEKQCSEVTCSWANLKNDISGSDC